MLIVLLVVAVIFKRKPSGIAVEVAKAEQRTLVEKVSASGKLFPREELAIISEIAGEIKELLVEEGDSVVQGQPLVKINPDLYMDGLRRAEAAVLTAKANLGNARARLEQTKAQYERTRLDFNRQKQLWDQKVISQSEYEAAQAQFAVAEGEKKAAEESVNAASFTVQSTEAGLQESRNNLLRTTVYAPMAGIVTALNVEEGKVVGGIATFAATEMMRISNMDVIEARVDVSENDILRISLGDTAIIEVEAYDDRQFKGVVTQVSTSAAGRAAQLSSEQATNFTVKVQLLDESYTEIGNRRRGRFPFLPGMSCAVEIITETRGGVVTIPIEAVTTRTPKQLRDSVMTDGLKEDDLVEIVYVRGDDGKVKPLKVKTGIQDDRYIEILEGIDDGQEVISGPYTTVHRTLRTDDKVRIEEKRTISHQSKALIRKI